MLRSREWVIYSLLAVMGLSLPVRESAAGWFAFSKSKGPVTAANRGQSPDPNDSGSGAPAGQLGSSAEVPQEYYDNTQVPPGYADESSPCFSPRSQGLFGSRCGPRHCCNSADCCSCCNCYDGTGRFNCGDNDHYIDCTKFHRRKCGETWYPRVAPYCRPSWGWTQPCWRRALDNYNCPRPVAVPAKAPQSAPRSPTLPPTVPPATVPPAPLSEPPPPPPDESDVVPQAARNGLMNRTSESLQRERPYLTGPASAVNALPARTSKWSFTDSGN